MKDYKIRNVEDFMEEIGKMRNELLKVARVYLAKEEDAEDIVSETIITAFTSIKELKNERALKKWIMTILVNKCKKFYKRKERGEYEESFEQLERIESPNKLINVDDEIDFNIRINSFEADIKLIMYLFYKERYKISEISEITGINENTVKSKLSRSRRKIEQKEIRKQENREQKIWNYKEKRF